jgi:putative heme-binding domain-containing protein
VHRNAAARGLTPDQDRVVLELTQGRNVLLFKVVNVGGPWGLSARILPPSREPTVKELGYDAAARVAAALPGDRELGAKLFTAQRCALCHTVGREQKPLGPFLGDVGDRMKRSELLDAVLLPSKQVAQGFQTRWFALKNGAAFTGFVVRESSSEIELRDLLGNAHVLARAELEQEARMVGSMMPPGLADDLTPGQLAALLAYLEGLRAGK